MKRGKSIGFMIFLLGGALTYFYTKNALTVPVSDRPEGWWLPMVIFIGVALCALVFLIPSQKKTQQ